MYLRLQGRSQLSPFDHLRPFGNVALWRVKWRVI
ncbi:unnamed protein product [Rhodiola kirilowii]